MNLRKTEKRNTMKIKSNERIFICGRTRTGKTYFARKLIAKFKKFIVYDPDLEYFDLGKIVTSLQDFKEAIKKHSKVIYQPRSYQQEEFIDLCTFIFNNLSNLVFVVDEVADLAPNNAIPSAYSMIMRRGAKRGIGSIALTQRVALVDKTIIAQADHLISFQQFLDNDINKLIENIGAGAEKVRYLEKYHYLYFHDGKIEIRKPI